LARVPPGRRQSIVRQVAVWGWGVRLRCVPANVQDVTARIPLVVENKNEELKVEPYRHGKPNVGDARGKRWG